MNTYTVTFRQKKKSTYHGFGYSEIGDKFIFHKKEDLSDKDSDSFVFKSEVLGIEREPDFEPLGIIRG